MRLLVDENIPFGNEAFSEFGEVRLKAGRDMGADDFREVDALVVRSVTRVDHALLEHSPVRFVGTATIGTDHIDEEWLARNGIGFASAAGSNARSVVEWVLAALVEYCLSQRIDWRGRTLGIVGHGNIGSRLALVARALGMQVLVNDPPLSEAGRLGGTVGLYQLLAESDFVSLHVPLTREGPHPTFHLIGSLELDLMKPQALLLNASRGPVLDNSAALRFALAEATVFALDVYENEPTPIPSLVQYALVATPHVAGYSFEGKVNGTVQIAEALAHMVGRERTWTPVLAPPCDARVVIGPGRPMNRLHQAIAHAYPIRRDTDALREGISIEEEAAWGAHFDKLRKNYPRRREFGNYTVVMEDEDAEVAAALRSLGFQVEATSR